MRLSIARYALLCLLSAIGALALMPIAEGQIVSNKQLITDTELRASELLSLPTSRIAAFDQDSARIAMERTSQELRNYVFAHTIPLEVDIIKSGEHTIRADGTQVWKYRIRSSEAKSLSFYFDRFELPEGALLYIVNTLDREQYIGGFGAVNNNVLRALPTQPIAAEDVIIELQAPAGTKPSLRLAEVNHGVRSFEHIRYKAPQFGGGKQESLECTPELACYPEYMDMGKSVVLILVGGNALGTGTLINNTSGDGRPLILTAAHVISVNFKYNNIADQAARSVIFFNYQSPTCSGEVRPQITQTIAGSTVVGYHPYTDGGMLELHHKPPLEYQPYYAGWNASKEMPGSYYNIHHPIGLTKRINYYFGELQLVTFPDAGLPFGDLQHFQVNSWDLGTTEGGSSGSPLFDRNNKVIGYLTGGRSTCSYRASDQFGALQMIWASGDIEAAKIVAALDPSGRRSLSCEPHSTATTSKIVRITNISAPKTEGKIADVMPQLSDSELLGSSYGATETLESYRLKGGTKVYGIYLMVKGQPQATKEMELTIYNQDGTQALGKVDMPVNSISVENSNKNPISQISELYVSLSEPLTLASDGVVLFGIKNASIAQGLSLVHQQHADNQRSTLCWRIGDKVEAAHQRANVRASLWLDPLVSDSQLMPKDLEQPRIRITPANNGEIMISLGDGVSADSQSKLEIFTLLGQKLYSANVMGTRHILSRSALESIGVLIIRIQTNQWEESLKVYFPAN